MKKKFVNILFIAAITASVISCKDKAKEAVTTDAEAPVITEAANAETYTVNTDASTIAWTGSKPTGSHNGTIALESGALNVVNGKVVGGSFIIDMKSITVLDIPADDKGNAKLVGHLTNADFFDVEKFPNAAFTITETKVAEGKTMLSGNLTLKEVKNNVTFPVTITNQDDAVTITSEAFSIDRTKWNVQYGSKSIFDNLGDKFINDDIELKITVKAAKS
ncbi:YceI family protein [Algibacter miyuki]|uniref:YceI family protein n=1 Tax=Algibacter miyuki TaxID=1306933 RepID=A0ABV5H3G8_9FLAO|nr:YceI family protein [Algibacter miyuki]MDN3666457.1 YceI family protein [Algibacter miyuki]